MSENVKSVADYHYEKIKKVLATSNMDSVKEIIKKYEHVYKPTATVCIAEDNSTDKSTFAKAEICHKLLLDVIMDVETEHAKASAKLMEIESCYEEKHIAKRNELIIKIDKNPDFSNDKAAIADQARKSFLEALNPFLNRLLPEVTRQWDALDCKKTNDKEKLAELHARMVDICSAEHSQILQEVNWFCERHFGVLSMDYYQYYYSLIEEDEQLSTLAKLHLLFPLIRIPTFSPKRTAYKSNDNVFSNIFLQWDETTNLEKYASALEFDFLTQLQSDYIDKVMDDFWIALDSWTTELQETYTARIDSKRISLTDFYVLIPACKREISAIEQILKDLTEVKCEFENDTLL